MKNCWSECVRGRGAVPAHNPQHRKKKSTPNKLRATAAINPIKRWPKIMPRLMELLLWLGLPRWVGQLGAAFHSFHFTDAKRIQQIPFHFICFLLSLVVPFHSFHSQTVCFASLFIHFVSSLVFFVGLLPPQACCGHNPPKKKSK